MRPVLSRPPLNLGSKAPSRSNRPSLPPAARLSLFRKSHFSAHPYITSVAQLWLEALSAALSLRDETACRPNRVAGFRVHWHLVTLAKKKDWRRQVSWKLPSCRCVRSHLRDS